MNITAGTYVFSLLYVLEPGVMVYIPILTVFSSLPWANLCAILFSHSQTWRDALCLSMENTLESVHKPDQYQLFVLLFK